jgi:hypothetical protein
MMTRKAGYQSTRSELHRVAAHILARRRFEVSGRFGLRASPGGLATPSFGEGPETIRVAGDRLVREIGALSTSTPLVGSTLTELARASDVDLSKPFDCGPDTPALGEIDEPIDLDLDAMRVMADWYNLGWRALDAVLADLPGNATPATIQLWPEHFDAATNFPVTSGTMVNLGCSPGDGFEPEPYVYLGPWDLSQVLKSEFWNAPFGAVLRRSDLPASPDGLVQCIQFFRDGIDLAAQ